MCPAFDHMSVLEDEDLVAVADGGEAVCNDNTGDAAFADGSHDFILGLGVERGGCLVQDADGRVLRKGAGTGYGVKGSVANGAKVKVLNTEDNWARVTVQSSGATGWIMAKYLSDTAPGGGSSSSGL